MINHYLVIYDISDNKRLYQVAKVMEDFGIRVQRSVFEVNASPKIIETLRNRIGAVMELENDSVIIFPICESDWQKQQKYGPKKYLDINDKDQFVIL